jgi:CHAT domain-containing protein
MSIASVRDPTLAEISTALLAYQVGAERIYVLALGQDGSLERFPLLTCEEAIPRIDRLLGALQQPATTTPAVQARLLEEFCSGWGRDLLPPWEAIADRDVLVVVPHDLLHGVPLHLVRPREEESLAISHGISYCSSATLFHRCVTRNVARRRQATNRRTSATIGADVLTGKDQEYRGVADAFGAHFASANRLDSRANLKDLLDPNLPVAADVLCVVCHGYFDESLPIRSGLLLTDYIAGSVTATRRVRLHRSESLRFRDWPFAGAPAMGGNGQFEPSALTVGELMVHCRADVELVALFGCSTGTGSLAAGDDYESLAYQWLKIGAASVLANLWEADFPVLRELAHRFALSWEAGSLPKALALRTATRELLRDAPELTSRPSLWGSLVLLGDWV